MMIVVLVKLGIELSSCVSHSPQNGKQRLSAYQVEHRHFHHALVEIGSAVLNNLDSHHLLRLEVLALDDLTKRALAQYIKDEVSIPTRYLMLACSPPC